MDSSNKAIQNKGWFSSVPLELHGHRKKLNYFVKQLDCYQAEHKLIPTDVSVIEVGCSNGKNISLPLSELGYQITGVDIHKPSIDWAKSHNNFKNTEFICQDFNNFDSSKLFDVVILSDILEHVPNPDEILNLAKNNIKKEGMVLVCIPNGYGPYENEQRFLRNTHLDRLVDKLKSFIKYMLGRKTEKQAEYNYDSGHVQFFRQSDLEELVNNVGLFVENRSNGALFGGGLTYSLGIILPFIVKPSLWIADQLPSKFVTTWYFRLSCKDNKKQE